MLFSIICAILGGISVVVSRTISANLAKKTDVITSTFFNYIIGLTCATLLAIFTNNFFSCNIALFSKVPLWGYLGGILGIVVVSLSSFVTHKTSTFYLSLFIFIGQLLIGMLIDYCTLDIISPTKIIGGILVLIGLTYNLTIDKKTMTP